MHIKDDNGALFWSYLITPDTNTTALARHDLFRHLEGHSIEGQYLWLHIQSDAPDALSLLNELAIDSRIADGLLASETRPRVMPLCEGTLVYLRGINKNPNADPEDMVSLRVWFNDKIIITARRKDRRLTSIQQIKTQLDSGGTIASPSALLLTVVNVIGNTILESVDEMDETLVTFETQDILRKQDRPILANMRRQAAAMRRYLAPQRDALDALLRLPHALSSQQQFELREHIDRMARYVEDMDLLRERAIVLQDELRNRIAEQQGVRMYVLSMVTAIFLPLSFLSGVFGMNVGGLPGTHSEYGFLYIVIAMLILATCMLVAMLWKRWL